MRSLPDFFKQSPDPRRAQGKLHSIPAVLAIAAAAVLCGMRGYKVISDWAQALSPRARARFGCYFSHKKTASPAKVPYVRASCKMTGVFIGEKKTINILI
ncbi:MAG: transposase family protein [Pseudomonadota bacterium]